MQTTPAELSCSTRKRLIDDGIKHTLEDLAELNKLYKNYNTASWRLDFVRSGPNYLSDLHIANALAEMGKDKGQSLEQLYLHYAHRHNTRFDDSKSDTYRKLAIKYQWNAYKRNVSVCLPFNGTSDHMSSVGFAANNWLAEWRTYCWLCHMNSLGTSIASRELLDFWMSSFPKHARGDLYDAKTSQIHQEVPKQKSWIRSFKKKWNLSYKIMPSTGNCFSPEKISEKDGSQFVFTI